MRIRCKSLSALVVTAFAIAMMIGRIHLREASAQSETPAAFDVISIRATMPDKSAALGLRGGGGAGPAGPCAGSPPAVNPGRVIFNNNSLYTLITLAYGIDCRDRLVSGGPEWARSSRWVIQAVIPEAAGLQLPGSNRVARSVFLDPKLQKMLQNLLADRFKVAIHRESKSIDIFKLTVARGGSKLQRPNDVPCNPNVFRGPQAPLRGSKPDCTLVLLGSMSDFLSLLRNLLDRPVVDNSGITGNFEFRLIFAIDPYTGAAGLPVPPPPDASGPSLFTALQEQLGLRLEAARGPAEAIVIDHTEMPETN